MGMKNIGKIIVRMVAEGVLQSAACISNSTIVQEAMFGIFVHRST